MNFNDVVISVVISLIAGLVSGYVSGYLVFFKTSTPQLFVAVDSSSEHLNLTNNTEYTLNLDIQNVGINKENNITVEIETPENFKTRSSSIDPDNKACYASTNDRFIYSNCPLSASSHLKLRFEYEGSGRLTEVRAAEKVIFQDNALVQTTSKIIDPLSLIFVKEPAKDKTARGEKSSQQSSNNVIYPDVKITIKGETSGWFKEFHPFSKPTISNSSIYQ